MKDTLVMRQNRLFSPFPSSYMDMVWDSQKNDLVQKTSPRVIKKYVLNIAIYEGRWGHECIKYKANKVKRNAFTLHFSSRRTEKYSSCVIIESCLPANVNGNIVALEVPSTFKKMETLWTAWRNREIIYPERMYSEY